MYCRGSVKSNPNVFNITTPLTPLPYSGAPVTEDRICYKVSCPKLDPPVADQVATDQFGQHTLTKLKTGMLCTPAVNGTGYCGNGAIDPGESCDGVDLGGASCVSEGFGSGTLACGAGCGFDTSACVAAAFPATGQTVCYSAAGAVIACASTRQDGHLQAGADPAFQDNGDGTATDLRSGLQWEKKGDDGGLHDRDTLFTWANAFTFVNNLNAANFAGHNDWRLPNIRELQSILNYGTSTSDPAVTLSAFHDDCFGGCNGIACSCTAFGGHWSSTTVRTLPTAAYNVNFYDGSLALLVKTSPTGAVRAVRGGPQ
jgi:hypothetical protein